MKWQLPCVCIALIWCIYNGKCIKHHNSGKLISTWNRSQNEKTRKSHRLAFSMLSQLCQSQSVIVFFAYVFLPSTLFQMQIKQTKMFGKIV